MKSCLSIEKTASSALIFAALGCLFASLSPAQAAPTINSTPAASAKSSTHEASESIASLTVIETLESASTDSQPSVAEQVTPIASSVTADPNQITATEVNDVTTEGVTITAATHPPTLPEIPPNAWETLPGSGVFGNGESGIGNGNNNSQFLMPNSLNGQASISGHSRVDEVSSPISDATKASDLRSSEYLQAQAAPVEPEDIEPIVPDAALSDSLDPLEVYDPMGQVTNVSQLRDVQPSDWAYEALRSLVERYGCIAGYPDGTYRGNRAMTRYEFAAGVNACLQQIERLITGVEGGVSQEDFETLRRLVTEFEAELASLGTRVDNLEGSTAFLEDNQFSTTTKLFGQAIVGLQGRDEDNQIEFGPNQVTDEDTNINVINNVQLSLFTQFGPRSLLLTSMQAGNGNTGGQAFSNVSFGNALGNYVGLGYEGDNDNDLQLTDLNFRHLIGRNLAVIFGPEGVNPINVFRGVNRIESAGSGPLSRFAQRNPIVNVGNGRGGIGFDWQIGTRLSLQGVYSASSPFDSDDGGIFGGDNGETSAGAQLVFSPTDTIDLSFQYINAYSRFGRLGTGVGDDQLVVRRLFLNPGSPQLELENAPINTNAFGVTLEWRVSSTFTIGGWGGYTISNFQGGPGEIETVNWMAFLNFPDFLGEGNLLGFYVGQPPKIVDSDLPVGRNLPDRITGGLGESGGQPASTTHWELFYRFQVSENISVTPGVIVIFDPLHNYDNDTITIGAIRTTFTF